MDSVVKIDFKLFVRKAKAKAAANAEVVDDDEEISICNYDSDDKNTWDYEDTVLNEELEADHNAHQESAATVTQTQSKNKGTVIASALDELD